MNQPATPEPSEPEAGPPASESPGAPPQLEAISGRRADQTRPRPVRWQWSLLTLLLLMAVVGSWSAWYRTRSQNDWYRRQIDILRDLAGELVVNDPGRIAAVEVPPMWHSERRWEVYLPEGHEYRLKAATAGIGERQFPDAEREVSLAAGRHVIGLLEADQREWTQFTVEVDGQRVWPAIEPVSRTGNTSGQSDPAERSQQFPLDRPLVLKRLRYADLSQPPAPNTPTQWSDRGLLLWIEVVP
ncbi:MAG: hypothetical protein J5I93_08100 [Pirellulaceae bacterium]|nr:hypothetical protein [Pirellulaceae bacterium]